MSDACGFQRARSPEQREARRQAILDAAATMLAESPVSEISLRELSRRVGLAKSNVLRYFETREEVFLELLDREIRAWLAALPRQARGEGDPVEHAAGLLADSLAARPLLCELVSATASVLERNISVDVAKRFKLATMDVGAQLAGLVTGWVPELTADAAGRFVAGMLAVLAGLWPLAHPTDAVRTAMDELKLDAPYADFARTLRDAATIHLAGALARQDVRPIAHTPLPS